MCTPSYGTVHAISSCPHSRDFAKSKHRHAHANAIILLAAGRFLLFLRLLRDLFPCFLHPPATFNERLLLSSPSSPFSSTFAALRHFFFFASRLHAKANTTLIYLSVSAGTHVIYCDLIAFNSSGATVNHRASRIARVRHACCRYDIIIRSSASPR